MRNRLCWLMLFCLCLSTFFLASCRREMTAEQVPAELGKRISEVNTYELSIVLRQGEFEHELKQWYQSPDRLRTDVLYNGETVYSFFCQDNQLVLQHVQLDTVTTIPLAQENHLFASPMLIAFWQEARQSVWRTGEEAALFYGDFSWRDLRGQPKDGWMTIQRETLLPKQVKLPLADGEYLILDFAQVTLNPNLSDSLFQPE